MLQDLLHRLPSVKELHYSFVGPALQEEEENQPAVPPCHACQLAGRSIRHGVHPLRYSAFKASLAYTVPDLLLVQNAGLAEFDDQDSEGWKDGWGGGDLPQLLVPGALLVVTSYTHSEAEKDLERLVRHCPEVEVVESAILNPMQSWRPCRDWENDGNKDVFYSNQYLSIVEAKTATT